MQALPTQLVQVQAELAAAVAQGGAEHQVVTEPVVGLAEAVALFVGDVDPPLDAGFDVQFGMREVVAQHGLDQGRRMGAQAEQAEVGQQAFGVQFAGGTQRFAGQPGEGEQAMGQPVAGALFEAGVVAVLAPDRQEQALQPVVEQVEEVAHCRVVAQRLLGVETGQRRMRAAQAEQVEAQAQVCPALFLDGLHVLDIAAREALAGIGTEFQALLQVLVIQFGVSGAQAGEQQRYRLEQAVAAEVALGRAQSRGCCPMRGVHRYTSPCVLTTCSSW
ncbi:hypothetical protein D9M70_405920 [compost metagenome]